jgi:heme exporter protein C
VSATAAPAPETDSPTIVTGTSSRGTRALAFIIAVGVPTLLAFAFFISPEDDVQRDAVRLLYIHVPIAIMTYVAFSLTAFGGIMFLYKGSRWWDTTAYAAGEIGVVLCGLTLITGSIWGRPTWGTWWEWSDVRLVTSLMLFLVFVGYLAFRRIPGDPTVRARRAAVLGLIGAMQIPIVRFSVEWWENNTLHQSSSVLYGKLENMTLFTWFLGQIVVGAIFLYLLIHRFRVAWMEEEIETHGLVGALEERRAEALVGVEQAVGGTVEGRISAVKDV